MNHNEFNYCKWCGRECKNNAVGGAFCPTQFKDWKDVAEFEARVALKLAHCIDGLQNLFPPEKFPRIPYTQILKDVRLAVEEQMES